MKNCAGSIVLMAFAGGVCAQSSLTLQGTVDGTISRGTGSLTSRSQIGSGGNSTSKLIIKGVEDLGGGMSALVWLEAGLLLDTGAGQPTSPNNQLGGVGAAAGQGLTFNRRSIVGLKAPWGEVHLGRDWSPMYDAYTGKFDPFSLAIGIGMNYAASPTSSNGAVRVSNTAGYTTPVFGGFSGNVQKWFGESTNTALPKNEGSGQGARLNYDSGALGAAVHWGQSSYSAGDATYRAAAAVYKWPLFTTSIVYNRDRQGSVSHKGLLLGLWLPVGAAGELKASYSTARNNAAGNPQSTKLAVGYVYNLSKRTAVYTTLAHVSNKGGARQALAGATTAPNQSSNGLDIGFRHNF